MKIKLIQSGGLTGKKMTAEIESNISAEDWSKLILMIKKKDRIGKKSKDAFLYTIQKDADETTKTVIDIDAIPDQYDDLFANLFKGLKP